MYYFDIGIELHPAFELPKTENLLCNAVGIREPQFPFDQIERVRNDYVAFMVTRGEIYLSERNTHSDIIEDFCVKTGEIHIVPPGIAQWSTKPFDPGIKFLWFHFILEGDYHLLSLKQTQKKFLQMQTQTKLRRWILPRQISLNAQFSKAKDLHQELLQMYRLWNKEDPSIHTIGNYMVHLVQKEYREQFFHHSNSKRIASSEIHYRHALEYMGSHYDKAISLKEVAKAIHISSEHLSRIFKDHSGETVVKTLLMIRINAAKELLKDPYVSMKEISYLCGFASASYFCRVFKNIVGCAPGAYFTTK